MFTDYQDSSTNHRNLTVWGTISWHLAATWWRLDMTFGIQFPPLATDLIHQSHNAPVQYPTMHHSEQKCAHFCSEWWIVGYGTDALWDLWDRSIPCPKCHVNQINGLFHKQLFRRHSNTTEISFRSHQTTNSLLQNFTHAMTDVLQWHMKKCVAIQIHVPGMIFK